MAGVPMPQGGQNKKVIKNSVLTHFQMGF